MNELHDLVIVGAGPAGLSAAIYAGRARLKTLVVDKEQPGGQIKITSDVSNYPGIIQIDGAKLAQDMAAQAKGLGAEIVQEEIIGADFSKDIKELSTASGKTIRSLGVIVATGAKPRTLGFTGEEEYTGRGVAYCATCDGEFFQGMDIFVIGGGFAAAEEAIYLTRYGRKVIMIVREEDFTCSKSIGDKVRANKNIEIKFQTELLEVGGEKTLKYAKFIDNASGRDWEYQAEPGTSFGVFVFVGYQPISEIFRKHVKTDDAGYLATDETLATNVPGVYAAGDIRPKTLRQLITAVADGGLAATNSERYIKEKAEALGLVEQVKTTPARKSFIDDDLKKQLLPIFEKFQHTVGLSAILLNEGKEELVRLSSEMRSFLQEAVLLTDKIKVDIYFKDENVPLEAAIATETYPVITIMDKDGAYTGAAFSGVPGGHEFNSFIIALYNAAGPGQAVDGKMLEAIKSVDKKVDMKICVSLSCTLCPELVGAAQLMAINNPKITAQMVDLAHFPDIRREHEIMSVPALLVNNQHISFGKKDIGQLLEYLKSIDAI